MVAAILQRLGHYPGPVLNRSLDNLLFSLLFKRPAWFRQQPPEAAVRAALDAFLAETLSGTPGRIAGLSPGDLAALEEDIRTCPRPAGARPEDVQRLVAAGAPDLHRFRGLMCKEPNVHVFLPTLAAALPRMRYVHVIRHGLDMALSRNRQQLHNWGPQFGVTPRPGEPIERAALRFWLAANARSIALARRLLGPRHLVLNYDALCAAPGRELRRLMTFLGRPAAPALVEELRGLIAPASIGRHLDAPADLFTEADRDAVRAFGFEVGPAAQRMKSLPSRSDSRTPASRTESPGPVSIRTSPPTWTADPSTSPRLANLSSAEKSSRS